jgi:hypothetical protein
MKHLIFLLFSSLFSDIPKPIFDVGHVHLDRIQETQSVYIILPTDYTLTEKYRWCFTINNVKVVEYGIYTNRSDVLHEQFDTQQYNFFGIDPNGHDSKNYTLDIPITFHAGDMFRIDVKAMSYNAEVTYGIILYRPDFIGTDFYSEVVSTITIDSYLEDPGGFCGDSLHPYPLADLNKDCIVDINDLSILMQEWLVSSI